MEREHFVIFVFQTFSFHMDASLQSECLSDGYANGTLTSLSQISNTVRTCEGTGLKLYFSQQLRAIYENKNEKEGCSNREPGEH